MVAVCVPISLSIDFSSRQSIIGLQFRKVPRSFPQHPDGEREFEVRIRDGAGFVEDTFYSFLWPRTVLSMV